MSSKPPTAKQLAYLRALAERTGQTFATPRTSRDASAEIQRLKAASSRDGIDSARARARRDRRCDREPGAGRRHPRPPRAKSPGTAHLRPGANGHDDTDRHRESEEQQRRRRADRARPVPHRRRRRTRALRPARGEGGARHRRPRRRVPVVRTSSSVDSRRTVTPLCSRWSPTISKPPISSASRRCPRRSSDSHARVVKPDSGRDGVRDRLEHLELKRVGDLLQPVDRDPGVAVRLPTLNLLLWHTQSLGELPLSQPRGDPSPRSARSAARAASAACAARHARSEGRRSARAPREARRAGFRSPRSSPRGSEDEHPVRAPRPSVQPARPRSA